ncbi:MAG TPA: hypothetical protein VLN42_02345 [Casimicrobiaceae bacterium]|nr:hypothetical protein [Casimicrobiaceae bacterium]
MPTIAGQSYRDPVLVLDAANPIMAQGAALADLPMLAGFDCDITAVIATGARIELIPDQALLRVLD